VLAEALHSGKNQPLATAFYGLTLSVIGVLVVCMWAYAAHGHRLLSDRISKEAATRRTRTLLVGPVFYAIGSALALIAPENIARHLCNLIVNGHLCAPWRRPSRSAYCLAMPKVCPWRKPLTRVMNAQ
jgi:hypothetical protein